jgi:HlyD family secretion protein
MKRRIFFLVIVIAVVLVAAGLLWSGWFHREDPNRIRLSGNIELTQVDISFKVAGKLIERTVNEGDAVKKGQLIARIDRQQMEQQKMRDTAGFQSAESQLAQMGSSILWEAQTLESDLALKRADVRVAQAHLDELLAGSRKQEIQEAQSAVADVKAQADQAKLDWDRAQKLFAADDISKSQYDQFKARLDSTAAALKQAQERLALVQEGPRKEEIESARAQVARAQAALKMGEANRMELRRREQELTGRKAEVDRAKAQIGMTDSQLADTVVISPIDGVVLVKAAETGEVLAAGSTVVTIGDLDHPWLRGYISERDIGRVKLGTKAKMTGDSFKGKVYWGRVSFIASQAEFTPKQIQTQEERVKLVYRIKIDVENPQHELKSNMPVDAELVLD